MQAEIQKTGWPVTFRPTQELRWRAVPMAQSFVEEITKLNKACEQLTHLFVGVRMSEALKRYLHLVSTLNSLGRQILHFRALLGARYGHNYSRSIGICGFNNGVTA